MKNYRLLDLLEDNPVDKTPVISLLSPNCEAMNVSGVSLPEAHLDPIKMVKLTTTLHELLNLDNVSVPFCLTVEAESLGCSVDLGSSQRLPLVKTHVFNDVSTPTDEIRFEEKGRISVVLRAVELLKSMVEVPVIVPVCGPFTLSSHLFGFEKIAKMMLRDPTNLENLLGIVSEFITKYSKKLVEVGADIICVSDPYAEPEVISPSSFRRFLREKLMKLANEIPSRKMLHICGPVSSILQDMISCHFDCILVADKVVLQNRNEIETLKQNLKLEKMSKIVANISVTTLASRSPQEIRRRALSILEAGADILAFCNALPSTPITNMRAILETRDTWSHYKLTEI